MKRFLFGVWLVLAWTSAAVAQSPSAGPVTLTGTTCPAACLNLDARGMGSVTVQITGTGVALIEGTVKSGDFSTIQMAPVSGGAAVTSMTSPGAWTGTVSGLGTIRVRATSGSPIVSIGASQSGGSSGAASIDLSGASFSGNGAASNTGASVPAQADYLGLNSGGNLVGVSIGQQAMAASVPVAIASNQSAVPVSASSLPLPTGASTSAKQPALGTAGTASTDVISVQGIASGTNLNVNCQVGCTGGTTDTDDGTIASGQSTAIANALNYWYDGSAWKRITFGTAGTASAQVMTVQGVASMTPLLTTLSGTNSIRLQDGAGNALTSLSLGSERAITVSVVDGSGNQVTAFSGSGGTASNYGSAFPSAGTAAGFSDGTNMQTARVVDLDTGAGAFYGLPTNLVKRTSGTPTELIGQAAMAASLPVTIASDQSALPASQSGTWNITNVSGTVSLPTGAATAAKQPALGTAGSASADVLSVQGIASGTPLRSDLAQVAGATTSTVNTGVQKVGIADSGGTAFLSAANALNSSGAGLQAAQGVLQFDDTAPTNVTENQFGNARMSTNRNAYATLRDAAGNERGANVNSSNQLSVSVDNTVTVASHAVTNAGTFAVQAAESGTWTVQPGNTANTTAWLVAGGKTNNNAAPSTTNLGTLGLLANATAPSWTEGNLVAGSADLHGSTRVTILDPTGTAATLNADQTHDAAISSATGPLEMGYASAAAPTNVSADGDAVSAWRLRNGAGVTNVAAGSTLITATSSSLNVNCTGGCSSSSVSDEATFTQGTSSYQAIGGTYNTSITNLTSGQGGSVQLTTDRMLYTNLGKVAGTATVTGGLAGTLGVGGAVAHDAAGTSINPLLVGGYASQAAPSDVSADGDATRLWTLRNGSPVVNLAAGGTLVTASGANLNSNVAQINGVTPLMGTGNTGTGSPRVTISTDQAALPGMGVYVEDAPETAAGNLAMAGTVRRDSAATSAGTDGDNATLNTDGLGRLWVNVGTGTMSCSNCSGSGVSVNEDVASAGADPGTPAYAVRQDTPAGSTSTDGDYTPLKSDSIGRLWVNCGTGCSGGTQYVEDAADAGGATGTVDLAVRQDTLGSSTTTDGDYATLKVNNVGRLYATATIDAALPTGTNVIGALSANQTVNVAQVNGNTATGGNGTAAPGSQRVVIASDNTVLPGVGAGATGSAVPANAVMPGAKDNSGNLLGDITCTQSAIYDASTSGNTELVAISSTTHVYVCYYEFFAAGTVNVSLVAGTGTACASAASGATSTGTTGASAKLTPAYQLTAQTGKITAWPTHGFLLDAGSANALCLKTSAGVAVQAQVWYAQR